MRRPTARLNQLRNGGGKERIKSNALLARELANLCISGCYKFSTAPQAYIRFPDMPRHSWHMPLRSPFLISPWDQELPLENQLHVSQGPSGTRDPNRVILFAK